MGMTAECESEPRRIRELLKNQICSPVRWYDVVNKINSMGIRTTSKWEQESTQRSDAGRLLLIPINTNFKVLITVDS